MHHLIRHTSHTPGQRSSFLQLCQWGPRGRYSLYPTSTWMCEIVALMTRRPRCQQHAARDLGQRFPPWVEASLKN
ncbi:hypothetical protein DOTSEDRAFT_74931 [Dothistroma septosporum NZE10]|uniref:Uncharacterized protein n=1 Tax=Dothistroma septosporum (strain NZE10 / CBS 128990) TaxID=675120 RepID=N1PDW4_DOTSN|nr:hypothetical protein DOTSEDRAFT_74931 [Dothistroma septosporum NZE10]